MLKTKATDRTATRYKSINFISDDSELTMKMQFKSCNSMSSELKPPKCDEDEPSNYTEMV